MIDFQTKLLLYLQSLRKFLRLANLCLILASFKIKEPEFLGPAIDLLVSNCCSLSEDCAFYTDSHRHPKRKSRLNGAPPKAGKQHEETCRRKRRRKQRKSASNSATKATKSNYTSFAVSSRQHSANFPSKLTYMPFPQLPPAP